MVEIFGKPRIKYNGIGLTSLTLLAIITYYDFIFCDSI